MKCFFPFLAVLTFQVSSAAAATPAQLEQAQKLLIAKQPGQALTLLEAAHDPAAAPTQELFLLGMAAKQSENIRKAESYFRAAVQREPGAGRIRLELAEVLFRQGKFDASREELTAVRAMNPPEQVRKNIDGFIAQVDAAKADPSIRPQGPQKNWSAYVTVGLTSDSNVNAGPSDDTIFLYGLPFTLSSDAQETKDAAAFLRTGISHQVPLGENMAWRSGAHLSLTNYFDADAYDTVSLSASTGPVFKLGDKGLVSIPITYDVQRYSEQGSWYSQSFGIAPRFQYTVHPNLQFYLDTSISRKRYKDNSDRNLTAYTFSPSLNYQPHENGNIAFGLQYGRERSGLDIYANTVRGAYIGYQHVFRDQGIRASVTASYTDTQFDGIQAAYAEARHDISRKLSANISYIIPDTEGLTVGGSASYQENDSNLDINTYDRTLLSLSITKQF